MGCDKSEVPPEPIPLDQLAAAMDKAFAKGKAEPKELALQISASLTAKEFAKASADLQKLSAMAGLNKEQASIAARGVLTVNQALQDAQAQGDQKAAQTLKSYRINK